MLHEASMPTENANRICNSCGEGHMSDTEIVLFPGKSGDEDGNGWLPSLVLDHDSDRSELYVIVMDEAEGMAEGVPSEVFEAVRTRLAERDRYREELREAHHWLKAEGMCDCEYFEGAGHKLCRFAEALDA